MEREHLVFMRGPETQPTIVYCVRRDMAEVPTKLASIELPYESGPNGLPSGGDYNRVTDLSDRIVASGLEGQFIGHTITNGMKRLFFYHNGEIGDEVTVKTGLFKKTSFPVLHRDDAGHAFFSANLDPTPIEIEVSRNLGLHRQLAANGDDHTKPRPVDFTILFKSQADRDAFIEQALPLGYQRGEEMTDADPTHCHLKRVTSVEPELIAKLSVELRELAEQHGGDYDGWGCPVVS